jgi:hypothetical protein
LQCELQSAATGLQNQLLGEIDLAVQLHKRAELGVLVSNEEFVVFEANLCVDS